MLSENLIIRLIKEATITNIIIIEIRFKVINVKREVNYLYNLSRLIEIARLAEVRSANEIIYLFKTILLITITRLTLKITYSFNLIR